MDTEQSADDVPPLSLCHTACNPWLPNELRQIEILIAFLLNANYIHKYVTAFLPCYVIAGVQEFSRLYIANAYQAGDETISYHGCLQFITFINEGVGGGGGGGGKKSSTRPHRPIL